MVISSARASSCVARSAFAPSTATKSVVSAALFAAAYGGFHLFKPLEVMYQETSNAVMFALLVHDVVNPKAAARTAAKDRENPYQVTPLFQLLAPCFEGHILFYPFSLKLITKLMKYAYVPVLHYTPSKYYILETKFEHTD